MSKITSFWDKAHLASFLKSFKNRFLVYTGISDIVSFAYAIFYGVVAAIASSSWFWSLAMYYLILALMRGGVLINCVKNSNKQVVGQKLGLKNNLKQHLFCGIGLLLTIIALSIAISLMISFGASFKYAGLMIYVAATYTFTKVAMSIVNFFKDRMRKDITVETIRNIGLADAAVSILALQTAMFESFAVGQDMRCFNALTGAFVCLLIICLAVLMIIKSSVMVRQLKRKIGECNGRAK